MPRPMIDTARSVPNVFRLLRTEHHTGKWKFDAGCKGFQVSECIVLIPAPAGCLRTEKTKVCNGTYQVVLSCGPYSLSPW